MYRDRFAFSKRLLETSCRSRSLYPFQLRFDRDRDRNRPPQEHENALK